MSSLIQSQSVSCIPYATDVSRGHYPHVDLRIDPDKIDEIEELKSEPLLKCLVALLNSQNGRLMTLGSAVGPNRPGIPGGPEVRLPDESMEASCWKSSYVNMSFVVFDQNTERNYKLLFHAYRSERTTPVCFQIAPAHFCTPEEQQQEQVSGDTNGYTCLIWATGWGNSRAEADNRWSDSVRDLISFFTDNSLDCVQETGGKTVSQYILTGPE